MAQLAATGRAYVAEDTTGFQDGKDEDRLLQYMQTQIGTTERLTMIPMVASGHSGEIVTTDATAYDVDDDDVESWRIHNLLCKFTSIICNYVDVTTNILIQH